MGKAIGIDLGTTNCVVAIRTTKTEVLQNRENLDLTPSVVGLHKGNEIVGSLAVDKMVSAPKDTIISVKRLMGRGFRDSEVQRVRSKYQYDVTAPKDGTDEDVRVILGGKEYSPIQISAMILRKLKEDAELRLNEPVEYAVITVPAYFNEKQKDATRKAGRLANLKVQKILDEPTAAAIAFGVDNVGTEDAKNILVYDLGGGTFDVSVLTIVGGVFAQLNIEGDMWLGGDDFDFKIMDHVVQHVSTVHGVDASKNLKFMAELRRKSEQAKKALSSLTKTDVFVPGFLQDGDGNLIDVEVEITRAQFESMIADRIRKSIDLVHQAVTGANLTIDQIDQVLLVGGSSAIPLVRRSLGDVFGEKKLMMNVDAMKCVAYGASILSAKWADRIECSRGHTNPGRNTVCEVGGCNEPLVSENGRHNVILGGVTPMHFGIATKGDKLGIIIAKGASYPTSEPVVKPFYTPASNLRRIRVPIYMGCEERASKNDLQATVWLELPEGVPADTRLDVAFNIDADGILEKVKVSLKDGSGASVETHLDRGDNRRSQLERQFEQIKKQKDLLKDLAPAADAVFEAAYAEATRALSQGNNEVAEQALKHMETALDDLLRNQLPAWMKPVRERIGAAEYLIRDLAFLLPPAKTDEIRTALLPLKEAVQSGEEAKIKELSPALDKTLALSTMPKTVQLIDMITRAGLIASERREQLKYYRLGSARTEVEACFRKGDWECANAAIKAIVPLLNEMFDGKPVDIDALRKEDLLRA